MDSSRPSSPLPALPGGSTPSFPNPMTTTTTSEAPKTESGSLHKSDSLDSSSSYSQTPSRQLDVTVHRATGQRSSIRMETLSLDSDATASLDPEKRLIKTDSIPCNIELNTDENFQSLYQQNKQNQQEKALQDRLNNVSHQNENHHPAPLGGSAASASETIRGRSKTAPEKPRRALPNVPEHDKEVKPQLVDPHFNLRTKEATAKEDDDEIIGKVRKHTHNKTAKPKNTTTEGNKKHIKSLTDAEDSDNTNNNTIRPSGTTRRTVLGGGGGGGRSLIASAGPGHKTDTEDSGTRITHHSMIGGRKRRGGGGGGGGEEDYAVREPKTTEYTNNEKKKQCIKSFWTNGQNG